MAHLCRRLRPVNPRIREQIRRGRARLFVGDGLIRAKLVVVRHPAVLQAAADQLPPIETEHAVLVANAPPVDIDGFRHYRPPVVDRIARERFGVDRSGRRSGRWLARRLPQRFRRDCGIMTGSTSSMSMLGA